MFGNVLNNAQIVRLVKDRQVSIEPFEEKKLRLAHYPLHPKGILWAGAVGGDGKRVMEVKHNFDYKEEYQFEPNEYAIVEIDEFIRLPEGIVGHFVPGSALIELGFSLTAGKIDPNYGNIDGRRQQIKFGIKNQRSGINLLKRGDLIAHLYLVDLRGLNNAPYQFTDRELELILQRGPRFAKQNDDGVVYPEK